ncbi:MAG: hypothetical protein ABI591_00225 [Kofleriaceae bacterium]
MQAPEHLANANFTNRIDAAIRQMKRRRRMLLMFLPLSLVTVVGYGYLPLARADRALILGGTIALVVLIHLVGQLSMHHRLRTAARLFAHGMESPATTAKHLHFSARSDRIVVTWHDDAVVREARLMVDQFEPHEARLTIVTLLGDRRVGVLLNDRLYLASSRMGADPSLRIGATSMTSPRP